ncbi:MAG: AEC family transporter [Acidimicrobiia bacterium]|nr:AEC family transporter [Acidimicrobiia bacterium]
MSVVSVLFDVLGPVVLVVALGALAGHRIQADLRSLSRLAYWVLGPAFMFDILADADLARGEIIQLSIVGLAGMAAAGLVAATALRMLGADGSVVAAGTLTAAYGNVGNAGLAVSSFAFGPDLLPAAGVFMLAVNTTGMMLGVGLAHGRNGRPGAAIWEAVRAPMTVASVVALVANTIELHPPALLDRSIGLVAGALIPTMLFTLGMQLRATGRFKVDVPTAVSTVCKLVVAPIVATMVAMTLGLSSQLIGVSAVQSAMPPAVFCMVVALEHNLEPGRVTATLAFATMLSLLTLPFVLLLAT